MSLSTGEDLIIGYDDYPGLDTSRDYNYSLGLDLTLGYSITSPVSISDSIPLGGAFIPGIFQGINLADYITIGGTTILNDTYTFDETFSYEEYSLTGITLAYNITIIDDPTAKTLTLSITELTLSGNNMDELLSTLLSELSDIITQDTPLEGTDLTDIINLTGLSAEITPTGTVNLTAVPVPGAVWLLGSGVVALAGLGRRNA